MHAVRARMLLTAAAPARCKRSVAILCFPIFVFIPALQNLTDQSCMFVMLDMRARRRERLGDVGGGHDTRSIYTTLYIYTYILQNR